MTVKQIEKKKFVQDHRTKFLTNYQLLLQNNDYPTPRLFNEMWEDISSTFTSSPVIFGAVAVAGVWTVRTVLSKKSGASF